MNAQIAVLSVRQGCSAGTPFSRKRKHLSRRGNFAQFENSALEIICGNGNRRLRRVDADTCHVVAFRPWNLFLGAAGMRWSSLQRHCAAKAHRSPKKRNYRENSEAEFCYRTHGTFRRASLHAASHQFNTRSPLL